MWTHLETFSQIYTPTFPIKRGNLLFNTSKLKVHSYTRIICLHQISQKTSGPNEQQDAKHLLFFSRLKCPLRHEGQTARLLYNSAVLCLEDKMVQLWPPYDSCTDIRLLVWVTPSNTANALDASPLQHSICTCISEEANKMAALHNFSRSARQLMYCNDINTYNK